MATLSLFGLDLSIASGGTAQPVFPTLSLTAQLTNGDTRLSVRLDGEIGAVRFANFRSDIDCSKSGDRVALRDDDHAASSGSVTLTVDGQSYLSTAAGVAIIGGQLMLNHEHTLRDEVLEAVTSNPLGAFLTLDQLQYWRASNLRLDLSDVAAPGIDLLSSDNRPRAKLTDQFGSGSTNRIDQIFQLLGTRIGATGPTILLQPRRGAIYLNADVLDPTTALDARGNGLLFQHVTVEARLEADLAPTINGWKISGWFTAPSAKRLILGVPALQDEQGHPLVLGIADRLPLCERRGNNRPVTNGRTNRALVIGRPETVCDFEAELLRVDPLSTYGRERRAPPLASGRTIAPPYWVDNGGALVRNQPPRDIVGWSRNGAIRRGEARLPEAIRFEPYRASGGDFLFMQASLIFGAEAAMLVADLPERAATERGEEPMPRLRRYRAVGRDATVALPIIDLAWSLADLVGPRQNEVQPLAPMIRDWTRNLDQTLVAAFPRAEVDAFQHIDGHRAMATPQPFARLISTPPVTTMAKGGGRDAAAFALADTILARSAFMAAQPAALVAAEDPATALLFGGSRASDDVAEARGKLDAARQALAPAVEAFFRFWDGVLEDSEPDSTWAARRALRNYLVGEPRTLAAPDDWSLDDLVEASSRLSQARDMVARGPAAILSFEQYADSLADAFPDEVAELIDPAGANTPLSRLFQRVFAPASMEILKRAIEAVCAVKQVTDLAEHLPVLQRFVTAELAEAIASFFQGVERPSGMIAELLQGLSPIVDQIQALWADHAGYDQAVVEVLDALVERYGPLFTKDVFAAINARKEEATALLDVLNTVGIKLVRLADLSFEPPDFLIASRRIRAAGLSGDTTNLHPVDRIAALWNHRFDFCVFGGGKAWDMLLDDDTTVIVKLGAGRDIETILREVTQTYSGDGRTDPFALAADGEENDPVHAFASGLALDLRRPEWRGVLIINPTIDLQRDSTMSTLCGFSHLPARYAAVGGQTPEALAGVDLTIWGRIERNAEPTGDWVKSEGEELSGQPEWGAADVGWSMTKFEATIRNTTVLSGEIVFRLDIKELFGRRDLGWDPITVSGAVRESDAASSGEPRDFNLGATFDTPRVLPIDIDFLKELQLRGVRIGRSDGDTTIETDCDLQCQPSTFAGITFEMPDAPVRLSDLKIRMPKLSDGRALAMGVRRALSIDLGAIRFPVLSERQLRLAGLEIKPVGVGLIRDLGEAITENLNRETMQVVKPVMADKERYAYTFLDTRISFGNGPGLDGGTQLSLVGRLGAPVASPGTAVGKPGFGIASLDARNLKLSLLRILEIEAERLTVDVIPVRDPDDQHAAPSTAGVVDVENFNLRLLSWSLFNEGDQRRLLFAQQTEKGGSRGFLAWYASGDDESDAFFGLQWLLIARNFDPGEQLLKSLLEEGQQGDVAHERDAISKIITQDEAGNRTLNARIGADQPWLFGIRFDLGELFKPCVLVMQDGRYYGIRLGGPVAKLLTGEDELNFAYIPGAEPSLDRFRTTFRCAAFDLLATMRSGVMALEWSPSWDFLIDCGHPWRGPGGYAWERSFSMPVGTYEAKFGFFVERRTSLAPPAGVPDVLAGQRYVTFSAGAGFYFGYMFEVTGGIAWVRAGIGVFGVLVGSATLRLPEGSNSGNPLTLLKGSLAQLQVVGTLGVYAYGEGGVEVWILSARFRVSAQAFVEVHLTYVPSGRSRISWDAMMSANYSASVRVGSGWFSWTFSVSGSVGMRISGSAAFG
ncbi:hypothetical protein J5288_14910 [Agrobacterium sp. S2/73]|uniref:hypothetical protein n=1 Tax=unclassified Agrobacterium TaxID=2632611 RepID=UPI001ADA43E5|nr:MULTISPECIES: hypothetical protein [unclassified Agrobacterium]MBO9110006.1 hypothetical protein [Agrobacterium sp. S2/73]QXZ73965.1 hypothetical protein J5276_15250 [Agrobacterium sp. S7/73]